MVLKLKCIDENLKNGEFNEWIYFDNFDKVKTKYIHKKQYLDDKISYDYCQIDKGKLESDLHQCQYLMKVKLFNKNIEEGYFILFNTFGYLLNDQGKTIERLN